jgi:nucleotide-binding universal stress UspA family protein
MAFARTLIGFDGSPASERALEMARLLTAPEGVVRALTVAETHYATHAGMDAVAWDGRIRADAERARAAAERGLDGRAGADTSCVTGHAAPTLLKAAEALDADLIAIGSHGHSRLGGLVLGSVATRVVHSAGCSVVVARGSGPLGSIVAGVDSSDCSNQAAAVAEAIARTTGASLRRVAASGGKRLPENPGVAVELDERGPVEALVEASRSADLLIVGSRGLHGLSALGSVAERVAHQAECSVLVVRGVAGQEAHATNASPGSYVLP